MSDRIIRIQRKRYRVVPDAEYLCRRRKMFRWMQSERRRTPNPMGEVELYDPESGQLLPISSSPYRWRFYVEPVPAGQQQETP